MATHEPETQLGKISPFFIVEDASLAARFYRDQLGFEIRLLYPERETFFAIVGRDDAQVLLKAIAPEVKPTPNPSRHPWARWDAFVYLEHPDRYGAELQARGVPFHEALSDWEDGLRGFAVQDRDGYVLFFGRPN